MSLVVANSTSIISDAVATFVQHTSILISDVNVSLTT